MAFARWANSGRALLKGRNDMNVSRLLTWALPLLVLSGCLGVSGCQATVKTLGMDASAQGVIEGKQFAEVTVTAEALEITGMVDPFAFVDGAVVALGKTATGIVGLFGPPAPAAGD